MAFSKIERLEILRRDNFECSVCGRNMREEGYRLHAAHFDHWKGAENYHDIENGQTLCLFCHTADHIDQAREAQKYAGKNFWYPVRLLAQDVAMHGLRSFDYYKNNRDRFLKIKDQYEYFLWLANELIEDEYKFLGRDLAKLLQGFKDGKFDRS